MQERKRKSALAFAVGGLRWVESVRIVRMLLHAGTQHEPPSLPASQPHNLTASQPPSLKAIVRAGADPNLLTPENKSTVRPLTRSALTGVGRSALLSLPTNRRPRHCHCRRFVLSSDVCRVNQQTVGLPFCYSRKSWCVLANTIIVYNDIVIILNFRYHYFLCSTNKVLIF